MTSQGSARTVFRRALERRNLVVAEIEAREVGKLDLRETLELTALIAQNDRPRSDRYRVRWLQRCLDEKALSIQDAVLVASALNALGGPRKDEALALLRSATGP
jgi:hypothetical protein